MKAQKIHHKLLLLIAVCTVALAISTPRSSFASTLKFDVSGTVNLLNRPDFDGFIDNLDPFSGSITIDPTGTQYVCGVRTCIPDALVGLDITVNNANGDRDFTFLGTTSATINYGIIRDDDNFGLAAGVPSNTATDPGYGPAPSSAYLITSYSLFFRGTNDPNGPFDSIQIGLTYASATSVFGVTLETTEVINPAPVPLPGALGLLGFAFCLLGWTRFKR